MLPISISFNLSQEMETQMTRSFRLWVKFKILTPLRQPPSVLHQSKETYQQLVTDGAQINPGSNRKHP
jgi:hypothetical protein